jgi:hypothetical protein
MLIVTENGGSELVLLTIDRFARVAVEACAVGAPGDVVRQHVHIKDRVEDDGSLS